MSKTLCLVLGLTLIFSLFSGPTTRPFPGAQAACAQSVQPAPEPASRSKISFQGGSGDTPESAVVIDGAPNSLAGISAEYSYLEKQFGRQNLAWKLQRQSVLQQQGRVYDRLEIKLQDGGSKTVFFDISEFFGKL